MYSPNQSSIKVELTKITFVGVPMEHGLHYRPYTSTIDGSTVNTIAEITSGGMDIGPNTFSSISGRILAPSSQSMGQIMMPHGWDQLRYSVLMEFEVVTPTGTERQTITGFTAYNAINAKGDLDPHMPIYINSHTSARVGIEADNGIRRQKFMSTGSNQILSPTHYASHSNGASMAANTPMRPADTLRTCQLNEMGVGHSLDFRANGGLQGYIPSNRDNTIGPRWLSRLCKGYKSAITSDPTVLYEQGVGYGEAATSIHATEGGVNKSILFSKLTDMTNYKSNNCVTVSELASVWPQINDGERVKTVYHMRTGAIKDKTIMTDNWGGAIKETSIAYTLCQSIPALMGSLLMGSYSFNLTNKTLDGTVRLTPTGGNFIMDVLDGVQRFQAIAANIETEVAGQIISSGVSDFDITMSCVALGSNELWITLNGGQTRHYSAPAYCDAMYSPVMGADSNSLNELSAGIGYMLTSMFNPNDSFSGTVQPRF